jgi:hypothetical protein
LGKTGWAQGSGQIGRKTEKTGEIPVLTNSSCQNGGNKEKRKPALKIERSEFEQDLQKTGKKICMQWSDTGRNGD